MYVIGLSGKLKSGKGTVAKHLKQISSGKVFSFAHNLREFCIDYLEVPRELAYTKDKGQLTHLKWGNMPHSYDAYLDKGINVESFMTVREVLEEVGTQVMRRMNDSVWCNQLHKEMLGYFGQYHLMLIDDLRFPNEAEHLKEKWGGFAKLIRLTRTTPEAAVNQHISNIALDDYQGWDAVVDNQNMEVAQTLSFVEDLCNGWGINKW